MSYENIPKNLTEKAILVRGGRPDYITLSTDPAPTPTSDEAGSIWEHSDTGDQFRWTSSIWLPYAIGGKLQPTPVDWAVEVAAGRVTGFTSKHVFGRNPDIDTASGTEDVWDAGGTYTGFNATAAETVEVFSSDANDTAAGTGARTVRIAGLDGSYTEQEEIVTLNGVTAVDTVNTYLRAPELQVVTVGSGAVNAGTITARQKTTTANVFSTIAIGNNRALTCAYTVPAGKVAYVLSGFAGIANKKTAAVEVQSMVRYQGQPFQVVEWLALQSAGTSYISKMFRLARMPLPAGTDIKVSGNTNTDDVALSAGLEIAEELV